MPSIIHIGLDIGSTTVKILLLDEEKNVLYSCYQRHFSDVRPYAAQLIKNSLQYIENREEYSYTLTVTGSGAIALAQEKSIDFVQEVIASTTSIQQNLPHADVCIELGGEDAKIIFLTNGIEQRMNEACAGGTGAFIDQMAEFLHTDAEGLNALAAHYKTIFPIASRCGVFAKTDILPLLNEGCQKADIAVSIFQAVVDQVIGGLACGREIKGNVVFLGGPLAFLSELRKRFIQTLDLKPEAVLFPEKAEFYVALGAALHAQNNYQLGLKQQVWNAEELFSFTEKLTDKSQQEFSVHLPPLFASEEEKQIFLNRHYQVNHVQRKELASLKGSLENPTPLYLGIDAGSTTLKAVLITKEKELVFSYYISHQGEPLEFAISMLKTMYSQLPPHVYIASAGATGYGSALLKAALKLNIDEVETLAHFKAAKYFQPDISYILDIGGQDIKCMQIKQGMVYSIKLNEACSAGCGSFIETFAKSLNIPLDIFIKAALEAKSPVDLGTRCTVFMNSKVKQAQKEGVSIGDIAAGLSYSVIKNALYKVIRIASPEELGNHIMVQGGAFYNDALLRALELSINKPIMRMDIAGLMGAYGIALLAQEAEESQQTLISYKDTLNFKAYTSSVRCQKCTNRCVLTITKLADNTKVISGNRCEKGSGKSLKSETQINMYHYKYQRLFEQYTPLEKSLAPRGVVGIPRVLNMYENYPFWFTFFTSLGFSVLLSSHSSKQVYNLGISTIPSQAVCFPAKLAHGHLLDLIQKKPDFIFFPCIPKEKKEFASQDDHYNCPVVGGYPELLKNNIDSLRDNSIPLLCPFLVLKKESILVALKNISFFKNISKEELSQALSLAFSEQKNFKLDIQNKGKEYLQILQTTQKKGIVLAGHPYHIDPEIHHGIPELINSMGLAVFTEDSLSHLTQDSPKLQFVDQWTYHARLYRATYFVTKQKQLSFVQLISFGCGLDVITAEQIEAILTKNNSLYTQIKIDEGFNLGAARIRIRSLFAVLKERESNPTVIVNEENNEYENPIFTEEMKKTHTIILPQMSPMHFQFMENMLKASGYNALLLPHVSKAAIELGLKYVNNDACYPCITVIGQLLYALEHQNLDKNKVALLISQTGGGCRATNYIGFLRKALINAGLSHIPILSFHVSGKDTNTGFHISKDMLFRLIQGCFYGDILMHMLYRTRPYELEPGSAMKLIEKWSTYINSTIASTSFIHCYKTIYKIVKEFNALPLKDLPRKPKVGIVGEILLKFHPDANNKAIDIIEAEGGEVVVPDLFDFFLYCFIDEIFRYQIMATSKKSAMKNTLALRFLLTLRYPIYLILKSFPKFRSPIPFKELMKKIDTLVSLGHQTGEGWLLTAEMVELIESDVLNILCMQPFGCLPNHITGRGVIKELKRRYPYANVTAVDYDPSTSETNQINRIKLIMSLARLSK